MNAKEGQSVFDVVLQEFGTLQNLFDFLEDNDLSVNSKLRGGQALTLKTANKGVENVKKYFANNNFVVNNSQEDKPSYGGDYNNDYSNDYF